MSFDRIKTPQERLLQRDADPDPTGRGALFSAYGPGQPITDGLALHCSSCDASTPLDPQTAARAALSLFLLAPWRRDHPVFALCPACGRRAWVAVRAR